MANDHQKPEASGMDGAKPRVFAVAPDGLATLVDKRPRPIRRTLRVTPEGLDAVLDGENPPFVGSAPDLYPNPTADITGHQHHRPNANYDAEEEDNNRFVGHDPTGKHPPLHPLDNAGPNPFGNRHFMGEEFPGMLTFDPAGNPTFLSRFPELKKLEDVKELRLNIASKLPDYMQGDTSQAIEVRTMEDEAFSGKPLTEAFQSVDAKMISQVKKYAKEFEQAYGVKITVGTDLPDAHLSLMGYRSGNANLLGFASFPPSINEWPEMEGLGDHPGYLLLNNNYTNTATRKECYDLFAHEFGHTLGLAHPHDLAVLNIDKRQALTATKMAYTDLKIDSFQHNVTDGKGNPVKDASGNVKIYTEGPDEGVLDYGFRKWVPNPPTMGHVSDPDPESPSCDLYKANFDLQAHFDHALNVNKRSIVFLREHLLPMVPMVNEGKHAVLRGTKGDDFLDTNPGYSSTVTDPKSGVQQHFTHIEGHFGKVMGIKGNNTIIAAEQGDQEILPGSGKNEIQFLYSDTRGTKTITSTGKDTLVLTEDLLRKQSLKAIDREGDKLGFESAQTAINLDGKGIQSILVVNERGRPVARIDTHGKQADALNAELKTALSQTKQSKRARSEAVTPADDDTPPVQTHDQTLHTTRRDYRSAKSWTDRVSADNAALPRTR
ncbi:MAG: hypothetical protein FJX23_01020 [Alphaproteobacteria bacterium]|nr:hypothetical protein [Alphaproteobacteria bacterium]